MASRLPPLAAVRAFEAAARHGSVTRAAEELGMTQAAVSYQIKVLEERIGTPLFLRKPRRIELTDVGREFAPAVTQAFELLGAAYATARHGACGTLVVSTLPTLAANWLARRIGPFQAAHPELTVRIETSTDLVDFARHEVDVGIRAGRGDWPGLSAHRLLASAFTPMLSPGLAATIGGVRQPADLLRLPIIDATDVWWTQWLAAAGVAAEGFEDRPGSRTRVQLYEGNAAVAGQGVAILTPAFFADELADGRLIQPFDLVCDDGDAYWLIYPEARRNTPKIVAFRRWILGEIPATEPKTERQPA